MKLRKSNPDSSIDISSLIDVLFILLIFLMLAVRFTDTTSTLQLDLPKTRTESIGEESPAFKIQINHLGMIFFDGKETPKDSLTMMIPENEGGKSSIVLEVDKKTIFETFVFVTDLLKSKGYQKINIITRKD
ncbi:ExbD/TolR family protein [Leptospira bandrabouensis]|uniref:Biopolymer transporter ExbD n=1 Tax=Leptospira bandrabouensis TaxID=2484903 RepID=A0A6H3NQL0_9LEPT|nr:biopolymer transporter ExbD [Leptospira bandrabouensis]MCG6146384.1 biopolymer transporter ExbD [Leptospira bandrabouensis]MCG6153752.1 biopolymer transporter ExbD [Leptospira bandrabouensis]MCG6161201.1 biopolymer transporter ExbD [Leptospira bandrabouensis]MCG6165971.1 biopolymer transporter ExbD [Leptospira bandrabouensis]MCW7458034.1 biopolymer transporter ExbD [Leptospira bandrabouensis]